MENIQGFLILFLLGLSYFLWKKLKVWLAEKEREGILFDEEVNRKGKITKNDNFISDVEKDNPDIIKEWKNTSIKWDNPPEYSDFLTALHNWGTDSLMSKISLDAHEDLLNLELDENFPNNLDIGKIMDEYDFECLDKNNVSLYLKFLISRSDIDKDKFLKSFEENENDTDWNWRE